MNDKTHFRKVFKSDHLGVADLEEYIEAGSDLVFTIKHVRQEYGVKVAGRKIDANIAYFEGGIKPLVVNATNSKVMKELSGGSPFVEDWGGISIQLYIDASAKLKGETVGGVRISNKHISINTELYQKIKDAKTEDDVKALWLGECGQADAFLNAINERLVELRA